MGQEKRRGTFSQRLEQATLANEELKKEVLDSTSNITKFADLSNLIEKHGSQKFRMSLNRHITTNQK